MAAPSTHGLDLHGSYQPVSDWNAIPAFPLMSVKATEGASTVQRNSALYFQHFRQRQFRYRGAYHWLRSDSTPKSQFDNVRRWWDARGGMQQGEFQQNDWERTPGAEDVHLDQVLEFNALCQSEWPGRLIVYVSDWVTNFHQWLATNPVEPLWYANYNTNPDRVDSGWQECAKYHAAIWQYTSSYVSPGITTRCDASHLFDVAAVEKAAGYTLVAPPPVVMPPAPASPDSGEDDMEIRIVSNAQELYGVPPTKVKFLVKSDLTIRHLTYAQWKALGSIEGEPLDNSELSELGSPVSP